MKKFITTALAVAAAAATLSACNVDTSTNAAGTTSDYTASTTNTHTQAPAAPKYTVAQENAIESARSYLAMGSGFSRAGLIEQLSSTSGDGFTRRLAVFAVNHIKVNWNQQAVLSAKAYLSEGTGFSRASLIDQLHASAGDGFTLAQATYAANHVGL